MFIVRSLGLNNSSHAPGHWFIQCLNVLGDDLSPDPSFEFFQPCDWSGVLAACPSLTWLNWVEIWEISWPTLKTLDTSLLQPFPHWHCLMGQRPVLHKLRWLQFFPISKSTSCLLLFVISKPFELERWVCARIVGLFKQFVKLKVFCSSLFLRWDIGGVSGRIFIS